jgi:cobalt-precorrin 5A hydrolase
MKAQVLDKLKEMNLHEKSIAAVCSIDIKAQEPAIIELSKYFGVPYKTFTATQILKVENLFKVSEFVKSAIGVGAVAEPCVYLAGAEIIMHKVNMDAMTLAIGKMRSEK